MKRKNKAKVGRSLWNVGLGTTWDPFLWWESFLLCQSSDIYIINSIFLMQHVELLLWSTVNFLDQPGIIYLDFKL